MKAIYPAIFHKEDSSFWAEFPDLEGCHTFGDTVESTFENAKEALSCHLLALIEQNIKIPSPIDITALSVDKNSFTSLVEANLTTGRNSVKKTLTIPSWLNVKASENNINFSETLKSALIEKLNL